MCAHKPIKTTLDDSSKITQTQIIKEIGKCMVGHYYSLVHYLVCVVGGLVILFSNNVNHLAVLAFIILMDAAAIVVLHSCPLTILEKKYLKIDYAQEFKRWLQKCNILYNCDHAYESQLELVINYWCFAVGKILAIMVMRTFSIVPSVVLRQSVLISS